MNKNKNEDKSKEELLKELQDLRGRNRELEELISNNKSEDDSLRLTKFSLEQQADAIFWMGPDAKFIYVNKAACEHLGYTNEELLKMTVHDIDPLFPAKKWQKHWQDVKERGHFTIESQHKTKDGAIKPVEIMINYMEYKGKEYNCAFARDITDRKNAEAALKESEEKFRNLAEKSPNMIFINNMGRVVYVNEISEKIMGYSKEEFYSPDFSFLTLIAPEYKSLLESSYKKHQKAEEIEPYEFTLISKNGRRIEAILTTKLINYEGEKAILGIVTDITDRKLAEKKIMEERNRAELFMDILCHDINNLNQAIITSGELLLMKPDLSENNKNYVKSSLDQAKAISELISNVRKLSGLSGGELNHKKINVSAMLANSFERLNKLFPDRKISINHSIPESGIFVNGNELLQDVFDNILGNAVKFNLEEQVILDISHSLFEEEQYWKLEFKDNGPGIPDELKGNIFKRLKHGHSSETGFGLGLTIVNEIIMRSGGKVWVEDCVMGDSTKGSNFVIVLPKGGLE
ncbi:MAG: PAS domain S-box protein [Thermoplasmata archaeon]|nr:MAG: PAS domain S-box protein [Thermoplasmata archaeon]